MTETRNPRHPASRGARRTALLAGSTSLLLLAAATTVYRAELFHWYRWGRPRPVAYGVEDVLRWLPEDTQTVIVARDATLGDPAAAQDASMPVTIPFERLPVLVAGQYLAEEEIAGRRVSLALEGSRRFRSPRGLGLMPYEGCTVLVFEDDTGQAGDALMERLEAKAKTVLELGGHRVPVIEESFEDDPWRIHFARPASNVLLIATHRGYLATVLERMEGHASNRALPPTLPEWDEVDTSARCWAVRHYDAEDAQEDPSSPLGPQAPANRPDPQAVGLVFVYEPDRDETVRVRYLSSSPAALEIAKGFWHYPDEGLVPTFHEEREGVIEIRIPVDSPELGNFVLFVLMGALGHAAYI